MGTIRKVVNKKGTSWVIDYVAPPDPNDLDKKGNPKKKRVRETFKTRKEAQAELSARDHSIRKHTYVDPHKYDSITLKHLCDYYVTVCKNQRGYKTGKAGIIKRIREYFGDNCLLYSITFQKLKLYKAHLEQTPGAYGKPRARATVNRQLSCLRHMLVEAVDSDMLVKNPFDKATRKNRLHEKENNMRIRYLEEHEIPLLLAECTGYQAYLHDIIVCAINTGMRKAEILSLKWNQEGDKESHIKNGQIYLFVTKSDTPREIPINDDLAQTLKSIRKHQPLGSKYVFTRNGEPIKTSTVDAGFRAVVRRSGLVNIVFHTTRHTFGSHFVMRGGSLKTLQEILGHSDIKTTMRYAHLSYQHKAEAINLVCGLTNNNKSRNVEKQDIFSISEAANER